MKSWAVVSVLALSVLFPCVVSAGSYRTAPSGSWRVGRSACHSGCGHHGRPGSVVRHGGGTVHYRTVRYGPAGVGHCERSRVVVRHRRCRRVCYRSCRPCAVREERVVYVERPVVTRVVRVYEPSPVVVEYRGTVVRPCYSGYTYHEPVYEDVYVSRRGHTVEYEVGSDGPSYVSRGVGGYEGVSVVNTPSREKVRRRNAIIGAGVANELFNHGKRRRRDIRKGAIAALLLNEVFTN